MALSSEEILNADDRVTEEVDVPEWGGTVLVKALSGTDRNAYELSMTTFRGTEAIPNPVNRSAKLCALTIVDENGDRLFKDTDVAALGNKSAAALERVFDVAQRLSAMDDTAVEEAMGNSDAAPSGDSTSDSPENSVTPSANS